MSNKSVSIQVAAALLQRTEQYVRRLVRDGYIQGEKVDGQWVVDTLSLNEQILKNDKKRGVVPDRARTAPFKGKLKALSFFSGCMGLDLGLEQEGIQVLLACESDKAARRTISANRPDMALIGDIRNYSAAEIREKAGLGLNEEIDLIVGGPPCQSFSSAGKRKGLDDDRGNVFLAFIDLISELRPRFVAIENVRGLLSVPLSPDGKKGGVLRLLTERLSQSGYSVSFNLYDSANFGSPQRRERIVIACSRDGEKLPYLTPTHSMDDRYGLPPWKTLRTALGQPPIEEHHSIEFPEKRLKYYRLLTAGQNWRNLPKEMHKEALGKAYYSGGGQTSFYRRLSWDKPSPTLVTHPAMPATDLCHPEEYRPLSIEEYKRIQEFPDEWVVEGNLISQYRQVGNAVPLSLSRAIARMILAHSKGGAMAIYPGFAYSRYSQTDDVSWFKSHP